MAKRAKTRKAICSGCHEEPRLPHQRYGRNCRNEALRKHRSKRKAELAQMRARIMCFTQNT